WSDFGGAWGSRVLEGATCRCDCSITLPLGTQSTTFCKFLDRRAPAYGFFRLARIRAHEGPLAPAWTERLEGKRDRQEALDDLGIGARVQARRRGDERRRRALASRERHRDQ